MIDAPETKPDCGLKSVPKVPRGDVYDKYTFDDLARFSWAKDRQRPLVKIGVVTIYVDASNVMGSRGVVRLTLLSATRLPTGLSV